jgi:long-chain fatty acid transport protein
LLNGTALYLDDATTVEADAVMKGTGFTPILSANISPSEKLNIALRYEFKTKLNLKTTVNDGKDAEGMFIQDSVAIADIPAAISLGINFKPVERLLLSGSFSYYFDNGVDYDGQPDVSVNMIDKNFLEFGIGAEYAVTEKLRISAGWAATATGVNDEYQSDLNFSTNTNSVGAGFGYRINDMIDLNVGAEYAFYAEGTKTFDHYLDATHFVPVKETYNKKTWLVGAGLNFHFGK